VAAARWQLVFEPYRQAQALGMDTLPTPGWLREVGPTALQLFGAGREAAPLPAAPVNAATTMTMTATASQNRFALGVRVVARRSKLLRKRHEF
jgi:hypothetical protein